VGEPVIEVESLAKRFKVPVRDEGLGSSLRSLVHREHRIVEAVAGVSFRIEPGEIVGFLGPNGAGKTTTLKMLSGVLKPSGGDARVLGFTPFDRDERFLRSITLIMGNKSQSEWDLPPADTFRLQEALYYLDPGEAATTRAELVELLELGPLLDKPARNLSLGERMRVEIALSLLHRPSVLFLDEPTLGLDLMMQRTIRSFLADHSRRTGASMLLTSHYMADVQALCDRVIVINHGRLLFDGPLARLVAELADRKTISVEVADGAGLEGSGLDGIDGLVAEARARGEVEIVERDAVRARLDVGRAAVPAVAAALLAGLRVADLTIEDPPIEDVIERAFRRQAPA